VNNEVSDWIGYRWLAQQYGVSPVQAFRTDSAIARSRATVRKDGCTHQYYPSSARPADTLAAHLGFALKHEGIHLEFLARLFDVPSSRPGLRPSRLASTRAVRASSTNT